MPLAVTELGFSYWNWKVDMGSLYDYPVHTMILMHAVACAHKCEKGTNLPSWEQHTQTICKDFCAG